MQHRALQDAHGQRVLHQALDGALERPGAVGAVVAGLEDGFARGVGELERDSAVEQELAQVVEAQVDDMRELRLAQRMEDHDVVHAVEELGAEVLLQRVHHTRLGFLEAFLAFSPGCVEGLRADVRGHDEHRVLEVHGAALRVGQAAIVEHLQEHVEDVRVGLLDLVEEHDRIGPAAHGLGELAALVEADVARRRADQAGHGVLFHVLAHVDADHGVLVVEQELGQRAGSFGFADAGGPEEDEAADGALRVAEARA